MLGGVTGIDNELVVRCPDEQGGQRVEVWLSAGDGGADIVRRSENCCCSGWRWRRRCAWCRPS
ncbi:Uncharacterised protein [Chromobacterium violaceum]|uniref:Uncharacterized protein n=1 Tax=Chromobacterium violaceum TaxID=536 RepID=A0A3S4HU66_CHRVL|nr:Uncharacterised protein [Chromobacterium violaceum]